MEDRLRSLAASGALTVYGPRHPKAPPWPDIESGIAIIQQLLDVEMPTELQDLYRFRVEAISGHTFINPAFSSDRDFIEDMLPEIKASGCIPVFWANHGACYFGLDVTGADAQPAAYYFDHGGLRMSPDWAAASSLQQLVQLLAITDEDWRPWSHPAFMRWVDPGIMTLSRAPLPWQSGE